MCKKPLMLLFLIPLIISTGCQLNNLNNKKNTTKLTTYDIKQLIGISYNDIEKIYGPPEKSTYYIKNSDLSYLGSNYITFRDFNHHFIIKAYYKTSIHDSYLVLWYKDNKVIKSLYDESNVVDNFIEDEINNIDYHIDYFSTSTPISNKSIFDNYKQYLGLNINDFIKNYNISHPQIAVSIADNNSIIYFYSIKNSKPTDTKKSMFIITINNEITDISIIDSYQICESIIDYIH